MSFGVNMTFDIIKLTFDLISFAFDFPVMLLGRLTAVERMLPPRFHPPIEHAHRCTGL